MSRCQTGCRLGVIVGIFCSAVTFALGSSDNFEHPNSFIGNAGWGGGLELWIEIADVPVENGITLPLRLRFASDVMRKAPLFGKNWWCPLLEGEGKGTPEYLGFSTFGGERQFLLKSDGWWSKDEKATGREVDGLIEIESEQWRYRYKDGKIVEAISPDGTRLNWLYHDGDLKAIRRASDGSDVLTVDRTAGSVKVHGEFGEFVFRGESGKLLLKFPDGREEEIGIAPDGEDVSKMTVVSLADGTPAPQAFRWKTSTGALLSDDDFTYETRRTDTGEDILHRVDRKGRTEWYTFDTVRGLATYKRQDGSRVQSWYHVENGPRYMKCFRMDTLSKDQALVSSRLLTYDAQGNVEKEWIEQGPAALEKTSGVRYIGVAEAGQLHEKAGVLFLDARKKDVFEAGHIPGAIHLGRASFEADYPALETRLKAADTLVVYCTSRQCEDSSLVATRLDQAGYKSVLVFEGGWAEWWKRHR